MQRWMSLAEIPLDLDRTVVSLGNFDGMHLGHRWALSNLIAEARQRDALSVAITFEPHPLHVLNPERAPHLLLDLEGRLDLMAGTGLDAVLVIPFTREFAQLTPRAFVKTVLLDKLKACGVVVGSDMRFGVRNSGDLATMKELGAELGFEVILGDDRTGSAQPEAGSELDSRPDQVSHDARRWSSSWVRELLAAGDVAGAAVVLGRFHAVVGTVVHGDHRGRELGFPTANLSQLATGMVPADGVYAGWVVRPDLPEHDPERHLPAAISVGTNPTFDGTERRVEAYVLDRDDLDLYGERIAVQFVHRLRDTLAFNGIDPLIEQMYRDVDTARSLLA